MATQMEEEEMHQITSNDDSEGSSYLGSEFDDSEGDPDFEILEETQISFSNLSVTSKAKARSVKGKGLATTENDPQVPSPDDDDFDIVQKTINAGLLEKLKVDECKLYLRKNGLRLTGNKATLIQRIKEHLEIVNGEGEKKYPPSSFVLNCKGDACTGDVVLFEQNVYEMFSIASRSATGPPCGKRTVAGRIVKESYGAAKQQHTFTIEVLWSKGEKPLRPLYPLLIKGRNLYRLKTLRQKWEDEGKRQQILMEKHSRGFVARADREVRVQEKEKRKNIREKRISKKDSVRNQCQSHSHIVVPRYQTQETDVSMNSEKAEFPSQNSGLSDHATKQTSAIISKPTMGSDQLGYSGKTPFTVNHMYNQQSLKSSADCMSTFNRGAERSANYNRNDFHSRDNRTTIEKRSTFGRGAELSANYNRNDFHSRENRTTIEKRHPSIAERNGFTERTYRREPLANANHFHPLTPNRESFRQGQLCRYYSRGRCYFGDNCKYLHDL
ncbi:zinc finger CCCH domain-containing protein 62-like [Lotus japonicus]|uniref:zinc finger CCCH domain-containing protein 62-like n=1 Tax=Lotus japonicus TaxID=34305 RepID=UPI002586A771|nr:zinc finger CCCH domain-containing protein 62-like [Lotus japonicus]